MSKRVPPEAALLMLHWQNSVCDPKGVWGKNLCRQIEKNNAVKNAQNVLSMARNRGMLTIFVNIGWRPGFPELPQDQHYPLLQGAKDENKGIVGTWEVDVIAALRPAANEPIVINFGSDSFEGTDLDKSSAPTMSVICLSAASASSMSSPRRSSAPPTWATTPSSSKMRPAALPTATITPCSISCRCIQSSSAPPSSRWRRLTAAPREAKEYRTPAIPSPAGSPGCARDRFRSLTKRPRFPGRAQIAAHFLAQIIPSRTPASAYKRPRIGRTISASKPWLRRIFTSSR